MGHSHQLTSRYNPHGMEKQARLWPVCFSETKLDLDIAYRVKQLWQSEKAGWADAFACSTKVERTLADEYGVDASRLAEITAGETETCTDFLESCFKWLGYMHSSMNKETLSFDALPWLEAATKSYGYIITANKPYAALALIRKASRMAPPANNISNREKALVLSTIYPLVPVMAGFYTGMPLRFFEPLPELISSFSEFISVSFALENGNWHRRFFLKEAFTQNPLQQLRQVKWVTKAIGNRNARIEQQEKGYRICFL